MEQLITLDTAKLIPNPKKIDYWNEIEWFVVNNTASKGWHTSNRSVLDIFNIDYPRPTQGHLQKYLRDEFDINVRVGSTSKTCHFYYLELLKDDGCQGISIKGKTLDFNHKVWEDALEAGLKTALEYLKNKQDE